MNSCDYEIRIGNNIRLVIKKDENLYLNGLRIRFFITSCEESARSFHP